MAARVHKACASVRPNGRGSTVANTIAPLTHVKMAARVKGACVSAPQTGKAMIARGLSRRQETSLLK